MPFFVDPFLLFLILARQVTAQSASDASRLGSSYTALTLYRGSATNILVVGVGTPPQDVNLTVSTNLDFVMVASDSCDGCTDDATEYSSADSSSLTATQQALLYTTTYPIGALDTITLTADFADEILTDDRQDTNTARPITLLTAVQENSGTATGASEIALATGTSGFWGLGVYQVNKAESIIPAVLGVTGSGAPSSLTNFTIGFDIANYSNVGGSQAGTIHWGGAPAGAYEGNFNWLNTNTTVAGSWGIPVDRIRVGNTVVDTSAEFGSLDPGFDAIYVPTNVAESLFAAVPGASRDLVDTTRWNLPCNTNVTMTITISKHQYNVASSQLVQPRDRAGQTCWGAVVAWQNGSTAERLGEIRLGTPFMSGVYSVLYYSDALQLVGIAGKPNSVNALNVSSASGSGQANGKLAGILIGTLLFFTILVFSCCYGHNHSTFQSIWYRAIRRQHRFQVNAMIRGASFPPVVPMPIPAMMPRPMPGYMPVPMHPEQMGGVPSQSQLGMAPHQQMVAPYPHPPPQLQPQVLQQVPSQVMKQPQQRIEQLHQSASSHGRRVEQSPAGFHSSRQHIISPHSAPAGPTFPAMFRNSQYQSPRAQAAANQARSSPAQMMPPGLRPDPRWAAMAEAPQSQQAQQPQQNRRGSLPMQGQGPMQQQQWIGGFPGPGQPPFPGRYPNNAPPEPRSLRPEPEGERRERGRR